ncbi:metal ABC transporter ATP-binding protein [Candidatus Uhrbacteria bacterium]|nr:metal ABC transporter ATP-binding protein [Candidatus Uhrbacteria bacterium]
MPKTSDIIISMRDVSMQYTDTPVLEHLSFRINQGEYVGILGPNGGGKTTLLKLLVGMLHPQQGEVKIFGKPFRDLTASERSTIGFVPQRISEGRIDFPATVAEVVLSGRAPSLGWTRRYRHDDLAAAHSAMEQAGIEQLHDRLLGTLSGGQLQRVMIARAMVNNPTLLLLDEPTVGVDAASQEAFYGFIKELNQDQGMTIIFVSHDIDVVAHEAQTILCVNRTLICHGPSREVLAGDVLEQMYGKKLRSIVHGH